MKVLHIVSSLDPVEGGGTAERTIQMTRHLANAGVDCTILTMDIGLSPQRLRELDGVTIVALRPLSKRFFVPRFSPRAIRKLVEDHDVIHLMGHWLFLSALVYVFARYCRKPYVVCPAGLLLSFDRSRRLKRFYNFMIGTRMVQQANRIIAITEGELPQFDAYGIDRGKITIIPNGVSENEFTDEHGRDSDVLVRFGLQDVPFILFMGTLVRIKGPDLLVTAFCNVLDAVHPYHLVLAGPDRGMLHELQTIVGAHSASDRVHFLGFLGKADKVRVYHAAKMLAIPSRQEAMSIVVLEAGATSTPVLLTDQCGFDAVADRQGGRVVPATVAGLQAGLTGMVREEERLAIMGANLNQFVRESFGWEVLVKKYVQLYSEILVTTAPPTSPTM